MLSMEEQTAIPNIYLLGLSSKSIHTIYAGSFVVYTVNCVADWLHTFYAIRGWTVTFALKSWAAYCMIGCSFGGGVLTFLLVHLCCENALWRRWQIEEYGQGCKVICQRFCYWLTDFDCFRISFLIMVFQDIPMTFINFWFISSCSIAQPDKEAWPFYFSCSSTLVSLLWRTLLTFLAYRHIRFIDYDQSAIVTKYMSTAVTTDIDQEGNYVNQLVPMTEDYAQPDSTLLTIKNATGYGNRGRRLSHYDECWPMRTSLWFTFNRHRYRPDAFQKKRSFWSKLCCSFCCCMSCHLLCLTCTLTGCTPCCHYYCCRKNAALNRQRFSKTCTRYCAKMINLFLLILSILLLASSAALNILWMSSVHLVGNDRTAPEVNQICVTLEPASEKVFIGLAPYKALSGFWGGKIPARPVKKLYNESTVDCKPLFNEKGWGFRWQRRKPTPWIFVQKYEDTSETLAIWTDSRVPVHAARDGGGNKIQIFYDLAYKNGQTCRDLNDFLTNHLNRNFIKLDKTTNQPDQIDEDQDQSSVLTIKWTVEKQIVDYLPWPYDVACDCKFTIEHKNQHLCNATF